MVDAKMKLFNFLMVGLIVVLVLGFVSFSVFADDKIKTKDDLIKDKIKKNYDFDFKKIDKDNSDKLDVDVKNIKIKKVEVKKNGIVQTEFSITDENSKKEKTYFMISEDS